MTSIQSTSTSFSASAIDLTLAKKQCKDAQAGNFDALLSMFSASQTSTTKASFSSSTGQSNNTASSIFSVLFSENSAGSSGGFGFSSDFTNAFGASGPLIDYINQITSKLHLSSEQNQALQNIAIKHKEDAGTAGATQQIAAELTAAGITA